MIAYVPPFQIHLLSRCEIRSSYYFLFQGALTQVRYAVDYLQWFFAVKNPQGITVAAKWMRISQLSSTYYGKKSAQTLHGN